MVKIERFDNYDELMSKTTGFFYAVGCIFDMDDNPIGFRNEFKKYETGEIVLDGIGLLIATSREMLENTPLVSDHNITDNTLRINGVKVKLIGIHEMENRHTIYLAEILEV